VNEILDPADTLRGYDRWSAHYDAGDNPMVAATAWALDTRPLEVAGARVLEVGCGTGRHAASILAAGARAYVGVDGSPGMLAIARAREPRATWHHADLAALPPLGDPFDVALIVLVLEHIADLRAVFRAVTAALRPGGLLRIVEIHGDLVAAGTVAHFHDTSEVRFTSVAHSPPTITAALADAGLSIEHLAEHVADGALLAAVPRLAKHRGRRVVLDIAARRADPAAISSPP
jgi:SAM-dependent methyltransferase